MNDYEENEFLDSLISAGTDEDWADFWEGEEPVEVLMNDHKLEEIHA